MVKEDCKNCFHRTRTITDNICNNCISIDDTRGIAIFRNWESYKCPLCNEVIEDISDFFLPMLDGKIEYDVDSIQRRVCKRCYEDEKF